MLLTSIPNKFCGWSYARKCIAPIAENPCRSGFAIPNISTEKDLQSDAELVTHAVPNFVGIASAGTGRELVHIEFNGSWSTYEVNYADTSNTTITTYQMSYEYYSLTRGEKNYELVNHLGNVLVVISDKKLKTCTHRETASSWVHSSQ